MVVFIIRYFDNTHNKDSLFFLQPSEYSINTKKQLLAYAVGPLLYTNGLKTNLPNSILKNKSLGVNSIALCLEDSIDDSRVDEALNNIITSLYELHNMVSLGLLQKANIPLIFIRIRDVEQIHKLLKTEQRDLICGFILPKFSCSKGEEYLAAIKSYNSLSKSFYAMPIFESSQDIFQELVFDEMNKTRKMLENYKDIILNLRIGGTDLCGLYGLRRNSDYTIYDISVLRNFISSMVNLFKRDGYVISGAVYEYFNFCQNKIALDTFKKEIALDKLNGIFGKTIIHPNQISIVNGLNVVTKEEYDDAFSIVHSHSNGVIRSAYKNKMNEVKPHLKWAEEILLKSQVWGVYNHGKTFEDLLSGN